MVNRTIDRHPHDHLLDSGCMMDHVIELIKVIFLGIVEGITEWLPISSTGHMLLVDEFIQMNITQEFKDMFLVVIQLGAILAVVILFLGEDVALPPENSHPACRALGYHSNVAESGGGLHPRGRGHHPV